MDHVGILRSSDGKREISSVKGINIFIAEAEKVRERRADQAPELRSHGNLETELEIS